MFGADEPTSWVGGVKQQLLPSLKLTASLPLKIGQICPNRKPDRIPTHPFLGANLLLVSGRVDYSCVYLPCFDAFSHISRFCEARWQRVGGA